MCALTARQARQASPQASSLPKDLHEAVLSEIAGKLSAYELSTAAGPDLVLKVGDKILAVEVKTGDPELPLPSSTVAQMHLLADSVKERFAEKEVLPILVTNYQISDSDRSELKEEGIQVMQIPVKPKRNLGDFAQDFANTLGLGQL